MAKRVIRDEKKQMRMYVKIVIAIYPLVLFLGSHIAKSNMRTFSEVHLISEHIYTHPFDIFPISGQTFGISTYVYFLIIASLYVEYLRRKRLRTKDEYGSSKWYTDFQDYYKTYADCDTVLLKVPFENAKNPFLKVINRFLHSIIDLFHTNKLKINERNGNRNMILSQKVVLDMNTRKTMRNNNVIICGGSGSGKTRFEVKPNLLQANCSYVITDPSGEILESQGKFLESQGYEIKVFNLVQTKFSHHYNPFEYIRDEEGVLTMITALIQNTSPKGNTSADPFWEKAETALLQAICFYLYYECRKEDRNFTNVMKLINCAEVKEDIPNYVSTLDVMMDDVKKRNPEHIAVLQYAVFKQAAGKTAKSILVSAAVRLTVFNMESIHKLTGDDTIKLNTIGDKKTALFCITPVADTKFNFLVALLYTQLFESLYFHAETECKGKRLPVPIRFMLDEFANIGTIPEFEAKLATVRKYDISCTVIIQNMAQLKTMYRDNWESITGNCDTFIFLGGKEQSTLEYVSKELGKETIVTQTDSRSFGKTGGSSRSKQIIGRELMTPTEIGQMPTMDCLVMIRGLSPFYDQKYDYPKHPNYQYTGDANDKWVYDVKKELAPIAKVKPIPKHERRYQRHQEIRAAARKYREPNEVPNKSIKGAVLNNISDIDMGIIQKVIGTEEGMVNESVETKKELIQTKFDDYQEVELPSEVLEELHQIEMENQEEIEETEVKYPFVEEEDNELYIHPDAFDVEEDDDQDEKLDIMLEEGMNSYKQMKMPLSITKTAKDVLGICPRCEEPIKKSENATYCKYCYQELNWDIQNEEENIFPKEKTHQFDAEDYNSTNDF